MVDWQTPNPFKIDDLYVGGGFHGIFFDKSIGIETSDDGIVDMPLKDDTHPEKFQNWLSEDTIDSFLSTIIEASAVKVAVDDKIKCSEVEVILPGISAAYGADTLLNLDV